MTNKLVNFLIFLLELSFIMFVFKDLIFLNIYTAILISLFSLFKIIKLSNSHSRKSIFVSFFSGLIIVGLINIYPIARTLLELTRNVFEGPETSFDLIIFYLQILFISASVLGTFLLSLFGFIINSKTHCYYYFSLLVILLTFSVISYLPFLNKSLVIMPALFVLFYPWISKYVLYFFGKYLNFKYYI